MANNAPLNSAQIDLIKKWKELLGTDHAKAWKERISSALKDVRELFDRTKFQQGGALTAGDCDFLFSKMKVLSRDMALNRSLYENNGLENFNDKLRDLLFGKGPLAKRLDSFFELEGAGPFVAAHLLTFADPVNYPLATKGTYERLEITDEQSEAFYKATLDEHGIRKPESYRNRTLRVLEYLPLYRAIKDAAELDRYPEINILLALGGRESDEEEVPPEVSYTAVSLEKDLRNYIAENPSRLEKGLKLYDTAHPVEYPTGVGRIDILLVDKDGTLVVVETKKGRPSDHVLGQILRYIGWLKSQGHKNVRGIIVGHEEEEKLTTALVAVPMVRVMYYAVRFEIEAKAFPNKKTSG